MAKKVLTPEQELKQLKATHKKLRALTTKVIKQTQALNQQVVAIQGIIWGS